ncbi:MAG: hypothetical protein FJ244_00180 [Nitrospira sp.]|nr:hypothetical protein [Nitrospira sp.]
MTDVTTSTSIVVSPVRRSVKRLSPNHLEGLAFRLSIFKADCWGRRAGFYERHRDYFPRLFAGRFVARCRELEASYRELATALFGLAAHDQMVPVRAITSPRRQGQRLSLSHRLTLTSMR